MAVLSSQNLLRSACLAAALLPGIGRAAQPGDRPQSPPPAAGASQPAEELLLGTAVQRAAAALPSLRVAEARVAQARFRLDAARAFLNPQVTAQHGVGANTGGLDEDLSILQTIELGGKRGARIAEAVAELRRAESELQALRARSSYEVRQAYLGMAVAAGELDLQRQSLGLAEQFLRTARTQFEAGEVPRTEVVRAELERAVAQRAVDDAIADVAAARVTLSSLIGGRPDETWTVSAALPPITEAPDLQMLHSELEARPELAAARAQIAGSEAATRLARRAGAPDFFVAGTLGRFDRGGVSARAGFTFPLLDLGSLRGNRRAAAAAAVESRALAQETTRTLLLDLDLAYQRLLKARSRALSIEKEQVPKAAELLSMAQEAYQHGLGSYLELLDAQRAYNAVAASRLRARADYALAAAEVERAAGRPPLGASPVETPR